MNHHYARKESSDPLVPFPASEIPLRFGTLYDQHKPVYGYADDGDFVDSEIFRSIKHWYLAESHNGDKESIVALPFPDNYLFASHEHPSFRRARLYGWLEPRTRGLQLLQNKTKQDRTDKSILPSTPEHVLNCAANHGPTKLSSSSSSSSNSSFLLSSTTDDDDDSSYGNDDDHPKGRLKVPSRQNRNNKARPAKKSSQKELVLDCANRVARKRMLLSSKNEANKVTKCDNDAALFEDTIAPLFVEIDSLEAISIDRSVDMRGFWISSRPTGIAAAAGAANAGVVWYRLLLPHSDSFIDTKMKTNNSDDETINYDLDWWLRERAVLAVVSNIMDFVILPYYLYQQPKTAMLANMTISQVHQQYCSCQVNVTVRTACDNKDTQQTCHNETCQAFDLTLLAWCHQSVFHHLRFASLELTDECPLMQSIQQLGSLSTASHVIPLSLLELIRAVAESEQRSQQYPWGEKRKLYDKSQETTFASNKSSLLCAQAGDYPVTSPPCDTSEHCDTRFETTKLTCHDQQLEINIIGDCVNDTSDISNNQTYQVNEAKQTSSLCRPTLEHKTSFNDTDKEAAEWSDLHIVENSNLLMEPIVLDDELERALLQVRLQLYDKQYQAMSINPPP